jgi:hypothetical protein
MMFTVLFELGPVFAFKRPHVVRILKLKVQSRVGDKGILRGSGLPSGTGAVVVTGTSRSSNIRLSASGIVSTGS